jgi:hypothetical protein
MTLSLQDQPCEYTLLQNGRLQERFCRTGADRALPPLTDSLLALFPALSTIDVYYHKYCLDC